MSEGLFQSLSCAIIFVAGPVVFFFSMAARTMAMSGCLGLPEIKKSLKVLPWAIVILLSPCSCRGGKVGTQLLA